MVPGKGGDDQPLADLAEVAVLLLALLAGFAYLNPGIPLASKFLVANVLAWCIGMQSIGLIAVSSFTTAVFLLAGLFMYDIYWVFGTDVMMTVATGLEAPVKFLFPAFTEPPRSYPFSVLGLGDIVVPATFCTLMRSFDRHLADARVAAQEAEANARRKGKQGLQIGWPWASDGSEGASWWLDSPSWMGGAPRGLSGAGARAGAGGNKGPGRVAAVGVGAGAGVGLGSKGGGGEAVVSGPAENKRSYFKSSVAAYTLGLCLCFAVNLLSKSGQPALLYLNPTLIASALVTALANGEGELQSLLSFESSVGRSSNEGGEEDAA